MGGRGMQPENNGLFRGILCPWAQGNSFEAEAWDLRGPGLRH